MIQKVYETRCDVCGVGLVGGNHKTKTEAWRSAEHQGWTATSIELLHPLHGCRDCTKVGATLVKLCISVQKLCQNLRMVYPYNNEEN